ncbi:LysR substrate-binding domain-containing protein [Acuticoccus sediminis]|uniref:LysR substrate-binding domain-containing protein n=1 Tax=Acuticoccus sediminis TaxID=2184697 RepID=UPI001CFD650D|nr:LysR substrate-binding domain-containing protein [Acuticoccus sediminis]
MKRGVLPLNALRAFESTARLGQMTLAADELGVTHGAVSRQVRSLEDVLGVALFEGPRNHLTLTPAGRELHPDLTRAFDLIDSAVTRITEPDRQTLDVSCLGTFSMRWLIPRLFDFHDTHPAIEVRLTTDDMPVDFRRQRLDAAVRVGTGPWPGAVVTPLFDEFVGPVLSPKIAPPDAAPGASFTAISGLPRLHTRTRLAAWPDWCASEGAPPGSGEGRTYEHFYFMLEAATAGLGVAIAPEVLVRDDVAAGRLVAPFGFVASGMRYVALSPEGSGGRERPFITWLADRAKAEDALARELAAATGA